MPDTTARLGLPVIAPSQAQKHVTHNEALRLLDGIIQLVLTDVGQNTPPALPAEGAIFDLGAGASGAWAGQAGKLAQWQDGQWLFLMPQDGWQAWNLEAGVLVVYKDGGWIAFGDMLQNLNGVGIGLDSDAVNRLAVASQASLFSHAGAGHQIKVNKASDAETASLLFQSNWAGHAEMGLVGDTAFAVKASADGNTWHEMLRADPSAQEVRLAPSGTPRAVLSDTSFELDAPLTGSAVQDDNYDTTDGRVLLNGAHGLGRHLSSLSGDLFAQGNKTGFYYARPHAASGANDTPHSDNWNALLLTRGNDYAFGLVAGQRDVENTDVWWNTKHSGTVGDWRRLIDSGNIIGAVSQGAGQPTGAVIERGVNANGEYVRLADGTQICWCEKTSGNAQNIATGALYRTVAETVTFPAVFVAGSNTQVSPGQSGEPDAWFTAELPGTGSVEVYRVGTTNTATNVTYRCTAIGRWF